MNLKLVLLACIPLLCQLTSCKKEPDRNIGDPCTCASEEFPYNGVHKPDRFQYIDDKTTTYFLEEDIGAIRIEFTTAQRFAIECEIQSDTLAIEYQISGTFEFTQFCKWSSISVSDAESWFCYSEGDGLLNLQNTTLKDLDSDIISFDYSVGGPIIDIPLDNSEDVMRLAVYSSALIP